MHARELVSVAVAEGRTLLGAGFKIKNIMRHLQLIFLKWVYCLIKAGLIFDRERSTKIRYRLSLTISKKGKSIVAQ